jgi:hypothetical protein
MKNWILSACIIGICGHLQAADLKAPKKNPGTLRIMSVEPTPESDNVNVHIAFPKDGDVKDSNPVNVEVRLEGYALGVDTDQPRAKEIFNDPEGQSLHVFVDNDPYFPVNEAFIDALDNNEIYYDQTMDFDIPYRLKPGAHVIRAFPVTSYNESIKGSGAFEARVFYFQKKEPLKDIDLSGPYLTYNEPQGNYDYDPAVPILLDFYIMNCQLSSDGYKVNLYIDGKKERVISRWLPYYIYGLSKGKHKVRIQLIDWNNKPIGGVFNDVEREIELR